MDNCTRCNRALKTVHIVEGKPYGPICVVKLFGPQPATKRVSAPKAEQEVVPSTQLSIYEEDLSS